MHPLKKTPVAVAHLTKILCHAEHPLSIQMLHNSLTQVFLSLWGVPNILCHHSTDLCIEVLQKACQTWCGRRRAISYSIEQQCVLTLSMALPTFETLPWMSLCRDANICTVSLIFLQHCAIVWERTERSASCTPAKENRKKRLYCYCLK